MKLRFNIDQAAAFRAGINANTSVVDLEVDPSTLSQEDRDLIANCLQKGIEVHDRRYNVLVTAKSPDLQGLLTALKEVAERNRKDDEGKRQKEEQSKALVEEFKHKLSIERLGDNYHVQAKGLFNWRAIDLLKETPEWKELAAQAGQMQKELTAKYNQERFEREQAEKLRIERAIEKCKKYLATADAEGQKYVEMFDADAIGHDRLFEQVAHLERCQYDLDSVRVRGTIFEGDLELEEFKQIKAKLAQLPPDTTYTLRGDCDDLEAQFEWKAAGLVIKGGLMLREEDANNPEDDD